MPSGQESLDLIKGKLVVSCQASPGDPLEDTETLRRIALAVVEGGAAGLRVNGFEHISAIRRDTGVPIIGIKKVAFQGQIRITPNFQSAAELAAAGASIIALDCTDRVWPGVGDPWRECVERIHRELNLPVMADIATLAEGIAAAVAGADIIGTTLHGYTEETKGSHGFDFPLLADLVRLTDRPVIAEGHISTPEEARRAIQTGAWSVVVGSAITRPGLITAGFIRAMRPPSAQSAVGVDIGGTSIKAGLVDREGCVSLLANVPTRASEGRDAIVAGLVQSVEHVLTAARGEGIHPAGLGIACAGVIDRNGSVFAGTGNLRGWIDFNLRAFAENQFRLPTYVNNDAHAAALAELRYGAGRELSDFVAITIGTGVGGGIVSGGRLIRGQHGVAGTLGHQTIREDGRPCNCGRKGCLEAYVSTAALIREYRNRRPEEQSDPTIDDSVLARRISQLALEGDPSASEAYSALAQYLAEGVANIFNILDPQAVILSGGLVKGHAQFTAEVEDRVTSLLHYGHRRKPRVLLSSFGQYAGVQGAVAPVFEDGDLGSVG